MADASTSSPTVLSVGSFNTSAGSPAASTAALHATLAAFFSGSAAVMSTSGMVHNKVDSIPRGLEYNFHDSAADHVELDSELWSTLPPELLEQVMRRLSFAALCKFRLLSKHWYHKIPTLKKEDSFLLDLPRDLQGLPWCWELKHCRLYDCTTKQWSYIDLSSMYENVLKRVITRMVETAGPGFRHAGTWCDILHACSDGGLLCVWAMVEIMRNLSGEAEARGTNSSTHCLFVCNPLTGSCKLLSMPPMQISGSYTVQVLNLSMQRDGATGEYTIFAVILEHRSPWETENVVRFFKYESASNSWTLLYHRGKAKHGLFRTPLLHCGVVFKDVFYFLMEENDFEVGADRFDNRCSHLFAYDIQRSRVILSAHAVTTDPFALALSFVVHNDRLLLLSTFDVMHSNTGMIVCSSHDVNSLELSRLVEEEDPRRHSDVGVILGRPEILAVIIPSRTVGGTWLQWSFFADGESFLFASVSGTTYEVGISCVDSADMGVTRSSRAGRFVWPSHADSGLWRRPVEIMSLSKIQLDIGAAV